MGRGRPRKPTKKHELDGTYRADRHDSREPRPQGEPYLIGELGDYGAELWSKIVPELTRLKLATSLDSPELFAMCQWWGEYRKLQTAREMDPYNRACAMAASYKQFRSIAARFGLTPADRARLDVDTNDNADNPFAAFMGLSPIATNGGTTATDTTKQPRRGRGVSRRNPQRKTTSRKAAQGGGTTAPRRSKKRAA